MNAHRSLRHHLIAGTAVIAVMFGGIGVWAGTSELSGAVVAPGVLVVDGKAKKVQHLSGGIVERIFVGEGQRVEAGATVIRLDATIARANLAAIAKSLNQLYARQARLNAERGGESGVIVPHVLELRLPPDGLEQTMANERQLLTERIASREGQKGRLGEQIEQLRQEIIGLDVQQRAKSEEMDLIAKELEGQRTLFDKGLTSLTRVNNLDRTVARLNGERGQILASIASASGKISETELELLQIERTMRSEVATEIRDVENKIADLLEQETKAADQLKHIDILAPIAGIVHELSVHTVGGVIGPAEVLMEIVPIDSDLTVDIRIAPQHIDQVALDKPARLRLTAFNRSSTPELKGIVTRISADLETEADGKTAFYRAAVSIPKPEAARLNGIHLQPGMPVETFIQTDTRTAISYLIKPLLDHAHRAFRED